MNDTTKPAPSSTIVTFVRRRARVRSETRAQMPATLAAILAILAVFASSACSPSGSNPTLPEIDAGGGAFEREVGTPDLQPPIDSVRVSHDAPEAVTIAARDVHEYLDAMGVPTLLEENTVPPTCIDGAMTIVFVGDGLGESAIEGEQTHAVRETRCGASGRLVELDGGGLLGRQYAAYAFLHELGVRFFHPEQEFVPETPQWPSNPIDLQTEPAFEFRSVSLHLTHPLELGDPLRLGIDAYQDEVVRYIDWQIKNFASFGLAGSEHFEGLEDYGLRRGLPRSTGFSLHNQQQGGGGIIDPDSPLSDEEQIAAAIEERMGGDPENAPEQFHFTFNPSEFTELPDETIVRQLTFIADYMAQHYPDTILMTTNHGTAGEPTENYGVRFYDLPKFTPENLGVKVHTLMFYDLERPAPVYGNENFHFLHEFMLEEYEKRRIWYYPESAWWLTFDIPVPLYLPITIEARDRDIQLIAPMLEGKLDGHRVFGSGHEWGYWQNEYCSLRMSLDLDYRWTDCVADIASVAGPELAPDLASAIEAIVALQQDHWFDAEIIRWLVGTDDETELAAQIGIDFHPLPPPPSEIAAWSEEELDHWEETTRPSLEEIVRGYEPIVERLRQIEDAVSDTAAPWVREIADGAEVNLLRARHAIEVHSAVVAYRRLQLGADLPEDEPARLLAEAQATTTAVASIARRRSQDYRYRPRDRAIAPSRADGPADENWTGYGYRYLHRAHHAFYYKRTNRLVEEVLEGPAAPYDVPNVLLAPDEPLTVTLLDDALTDVVIDLGDGTETSERLVMHDYPASDLYRVELSGELAGEAWTEAFDVARADVRHFTGRSGELVEPQTDLAAQIEAVMPSLSVGVLADGRIALGFAPGDDPLVPPHALHTLDPVPGAHGLQTEPADIGVPLAVGGSSSLELEVFDGVLVLTEADSTIALLGDLGTDGVVAAVVGLSGGAFDAETARDLVASALGYTSETLPDTVPFSVRYAIGQTVP